VHAILVTIGIDETSPGPIDIRLVVDHKGDALDAVGPIGIDKTNLAAAQDPHFGSTTGTQCVRSVLKLGRVGGHVIVGGSCLLQRSNTMFLVVFTGLLLFVGGGEPRRRRRGSWEHRREHGSDASFVCRCRR
jgi:hypothetical protein